MTPPQVIVSDGAHSVGYAYSLLAPRHAFASWIWFLQMVQHLAESFIAAGGDLAVAEWKAIPPFTD